LSSLLEVQENGQVFTQMKEFEEGMWVDAKDPNGEWQEAQIIQRHENHVIVHYNSLGARIQ
jgi:FKBP-type peptidyl-prolyl cis-trans isomerase 2